jgi:hypothetical protein
MGTVGILQSAVYLVCSCGQNAWLGLQALSPVSNELFVNQGVAACIGWIMLSTAAPGNAVWQTSTESLRDVLNESINFFYVNVALNWAGITLIPSVASHPVSEALFNFVNSWSLMFWPLMLDDPNGNRVRNRFPLWVGTMFLTNGELPLKLHCNSYRFTALCLPVATYTNKRPHTQSFLYHTWPCV